MSESRVATVVVARPTQLRNRDSRSRPLQVACAAVGAVMLLALAFISAPPTMVRAGDDGPSGQKVQAPDPANQSGFAAEIKRALTRLHDRMIDLANQLIGSPDVPEDLEGQRAIQQIKIESAKANLQNAQLKREVAQIAVNEYEQGIFVQEKAIAEEELKLARSDLEKARQQIQQAKDRLVQIKQGSKGSTADIANEFRFSDQVVIAQLGEKRAGFAIEQAESKLKVLLEFTKDQRVKELRSEVEKARSVELAKQAEWEIEKSKVTWLQAASKRLERIAREGQARNLLDRQALASLDRAIPVEERLRIKLEQLTKNGKPDDPLRQEIEDLMNQLQALVDQAEIARSAAQFDRLKTRIHRAANRSTRFIPS